MQSAHLEHLLKQLPPSASTLRLLDVGGRLGVLLHAARPDIAPFTASLRIADWDDEASGYDAIVAYDHLPDAAFLTACWTRLRAGGRLVVLNPHTPFAVAHGQALEQAGFVRVLVESTAGGGVLLRGERPHTTQDTLSRVQVASAREADALTFATYSGRFVHVLVQQTPNKPVWRMTADDVLTWQAVTLEALPPRLLGFSSLPKAVAFMQAAVLRGWVQGVNKVAKFRKDALLAALNGAADIALNPAPDDTTFAQAAGWLPLDPTYAEQPDE